MLMIYVVFVLKIGSYDFISEQWFTTLYLILGRFFLKNKKLHILILSSLYPNGSNPTAGTFVQEQAKYLKNTGCEITVVSPIAVPVIPVEGLSAWRNLRRIKVDDMLEGIRVFYPRYLHLPKRILGEYSFSFDFYFIKSVIQSVIKTFQPDVLHVYTATPDGVIGLFIRKHFFVPLVVSLIGSDINVWPFGSKLIYRLTKQVISEADKVVAVSNALKKKARGIVAPKNPIAVIYNGCDPKKFAFDKSARFYLRKKWHIPKQSIVFLFIGNILKTKGVFELLEAFYLLIKKLPDNYLIFIGDGKKRKVLVQQATKIGISNEVIFVGRRPHDEIPRWLSMADALVLPSYSEGLPNIIVEAMACQRTVIATKVGGIPEIIVDGQSGLLVKPKDRVALMKAMEKVARDKDLRLKLGNVSRKSVTEKLSWDENIKKLTDIYKSIMK